MAITPEQEKQMHKERIDGLRLRYGNDHPEVAAEDAAKKPVAKAAGGSFTVTKASPPLPESVKKEPET